MEIALAKEAKRVTEDMQLKDLKVTFLPFAFEEEFIVSI